MKITSTYTSAMKTHVRFHTYEPKVVLRHKAIVQIHHGIGEHADRYEHFASFLANQGYVVVVSDFAGHGKSLIDFEQGYFGEDKGPQRLIDDMHHLQKIVQRNYPDTPYFMLGVNFGSVLIRKYMTIYGDYLDGVVLLGTITHVHDMFLKNVYLNFLKLWRGPLYKSDFYLAHMNKRMNKMLSLQEDAIEWLTSDKEQREIIKEDPMANFDYTIQGYKDILSLIKDVNQKDSIQKIPSHIAVYLGVGENDPLSIRTEQLYDQFKKSDIQDVTYRVFEDRRHALLFEKDKLEIYRDILTWLNERTFL